MSIAYLNKLTDKTGRSVKSLSKIWHTAKENAREQGRAGDYSWIAENIRITCGITERVDWREFVSKMEAFNPRTDFSLDGEDPVEPDDKEDPLDPDEYADFDPAEDTANVLPPTGTMFKGALRKMNQTFEAGYEDTFTGADLKTWQQQAEQLGYEVRGRTAYDQNGEIAGTFGYEAGGHLKVPTEAGPDIQRDPDAAQYHTGQTLCKRDGSGDVTITDVGPQALVYDDGTDIGKVISIEDLGSTFTLPDEEAGSGEPSDGKNPANHGNEDPSRAITQDYLDHEKNDKYREAVDPPEKLAVGTKQEWIDLVELNGYTYRPTVRISDHTRIYRAYDRTGIPVGEYQVAEKSGWVMTKESLNEHEEDILRELGAAAVGGGGMTTTATIGADKFPPDATLRKPKRKCDDDEDIREAAPAGWDEFYKHLHAPTEKGKSKRKHDVERLIKFEGDPHKAGTKVTVSHNGKRVTGKVVRFDTGNAEVGEQPFYVVDVGEYESPKVPADQVKPLYEPHERKANPHDISNFAKESTMSTISRIEASVLEEMVIGSTAIVPRAAVGRPTDRRMKVREAGKTDAKIYTMIDDLSSAALKSFMGSMGGNKSDDELRAEIKRAYEQFPEDYGNAILSAWEDDEEETDDSGQGNLDMSSGGYNRGRDPDLDKKEDDVDDVMAWENSDMSDEEEVKFFQRLVDTGQAWSLQGMYGRRARDLIQAGKVKAKKGGPFGGKTEAPMSSPAHKDTEHPAGQVYSPHPAAKSAARKPKPRPPEQHAAHKHAGLKKKLDKWGRAFMDIGISEAANYTNFSEWQQACAAQGATDDSYIWDGPKITAYNAETRDYVGQWNSDKKEGDIDLGGNAPYNADFTQGAPVDFTGDVDQAVPPGEPSPDDILDQPNDDMQGQQDILEPRQRIPSPRAGMESTVESILKEMTEAPAPMGGPPQGDDAGSEQPEPEGDSGEADFQFANHGSVTILTPISQAAKEWMENNVPDNDETQHWGGGTVIEPRYAGDILDGIQNDGLTVEMS